MPVPISSSVIVGVVPMTGPYAISNGSLPRLCVELEVPAADGCCLRFPFLSAMPASASGVGLLRPSTGEERPGDGVELIGLRR